jgi:hypothetical protein
MATFCVFLGSENKAMQKKQKSKSSEGFQSVVLLELSLILQREKDLAF